MNYTLYQVNIEFPKDPTYCFEIGTNDFDAEEIALNYLKDKGISTDNHHVGAYDKIGTTYTYGVVEICSPNAAK